MSKLEKEIKEAIKKNLLWVEENIMENVTISLGELGCEVGLLRHLEDYADEFVLEIMKVLKENLPEEVCKYYDCSFFKE